MLFELAELMVVDAGVCKRNIALRVIDPLYRINKLHNNCISKYYFGDSGCYKMGAAILID